MNSSCRASVEGRDRWRTSVFATLLLLSCCRAGHVYTDSFPKHDEYDYTILDIHSLHGAPYGGFCRATRSRLAALPLRLPDTILSSSESSSNTRGAEPLYMEVTDADGRTFACRVYQEDELDPDSLNESMFDAPRLRREVSTEVRELEEELVQEVLHNAHVKPELGDGGSSESPTTSIATLIDESEMDELIQSDSTLLAELQLGELDGICGQIHKGWWSYEWCYETTVSQFHLQVDQNGAQVRIESVSTLGRFHKRHIVVDLDKEDNKLADGQDEIARVVDEYTDGQLCDETGQPRKAFVNLQCCVSKFMERGRGLLHRGGQRITSDVAAVMEIIEKPTCTYNVTVCTPLLCQESLKDSFPAVSLGATGSQEAPKKDETVRDILKRTLSSYCLQSETGGWWTYELCHGRHVRQYHEAVGARKTETGSVVMTRSIESEHVLGLYNRAAAEAHPGEDWRFVVNSTDSKIGGGNGAYFELEYTSGDVCDHSDVTRAAIIAGNAGVGGIERASSVRYYCGTSYSISVNEDSTCHYVVHVTVPDLCKHPLFMAPVAKKQVVKCLPVV